MITNNLTLADLAFNVKRIASGFNMLDNIYYPVLGAEGETIFIEIATGDFKTRRIEKTIYIEINKAENTSTSKHSLHAPNELTVKLPNESFFVAFIGLLQHALNSNLLVLHPLNENGNFLPGWTEAFAFISSGKIS